MIRLIRFAALAATAFVSICAASAASAADAPTAEPSWVTFSGNVALVSDYRFRGVSLSNTKGAIQGGLTATTAPGFFISTWGSSIATYGGANTEIDLYGGWTKTLGAVTPTVGIYGYLYPGGSGVNYYELYGSLGFSLGPVGFTTGINYAPNQNNIGGGHNTYLYLAPSFAIPGVPITLKGNIGYEDGNIVQSLGTGYKNKVDYMIGADFKYKILTFGMQWVGNNRSSYGRVLGDTFLVSLGASF